MSGVSSTDDPVTGVALVAGGSRGLGLLIAQRLLQRGYSVAISARDGAELARASDLLDQWRQQSGLSSHQRVITKVADVRDEQACRNLVSHVEAQLGPVDVLITVAGIIQVGPLEAVRLDHFRDALDTMTWGPIHMAWAVLDGMRERGRGRIGTVTSVGGLVSPPHLLPYATAKFAAVGFSEGLSAALAGTGVTSTTIAPGLMRTGSHERALFAGEAADEFAWFGPAASMPILSIDADRAARIIVDGVLAGRAHVLVGVLPKVAVRVRGLLPSLTVRAMGLANRMLPAGGDPTTVEGRWLPRGPIVRFLTGLGRAAAHRNNEQPDPAD